MVDEPGSSIHDPGARVPPPSVTIRAHAKPREVVSGDQARSSPCLADRLRSGLFWERLLTDSERCIPEDQPDVGVDRFSRTREKLAEYRRLIGSGEALAMVEALARREYEPAVPIQVMLNKAGGKRKTIYLFPPRDELMLKAVNRYLQEILASDISPLCHSFQKGKGIRTAFRALLGDDAIDTKHVVHLDVTDYFNSINAQLLLKQLPVAISSDMPLRTLLARILQRPEVIREGEIIEVPQKGVMAGTPLSCVLSNLYLKDLDEAFRSAGVTYARYSDDIIVFGSESEISGHERVIRTYLADLGLNVNEIKSRASGPRTPWEFLGLRYFDGSIDLAQSSVRKFKSKVRRASRLSDRNPPGEAVADRLIRRLNRKCYGSVSGGCEFTWSAAFFPVLTTSDTLERLDEFVQAQIRYAATGTRLPRNHRLFPYSQLQEMGYLPLTTAYYSYKRGGGEYSSLLTRRCAGFTALSSDIDRDEHLELNS